MYYFHLSSWFLLLVSVFIFNLFAFLCLFSYSFHFHFQCSFCVFLSIVFLLSLFWFSYFHSVILQPTAGTACRLRPARWHTYISSRTRLACFLCWAFRPVWHFLTCPWSACVGAPRQARQSRSALHVDVWLCRADSAPRPRSCLGRAQDSSASGAAKCLAEV